MTSLTDDKKQYLTDEMKKLIEVADPEARELLEHFIERINAGYCAVRPLDPKAPNVQVLRLKRPIPEEW